MLPQVLWISLQILSHITLTQTLLLKILSLFCRPVVNHKYFHCCCLNGSLCPSYILVYHMHYNLKII